MYEYIPNPKTKKAKVLGTVLFFLSLAVFFVSGFRGLAYPFVLQFCAVVLMTAAILIIGKYLTHSFLYRVEEVDGVWELAVDELTRASRVTVCRLELTKLLRVEPITKDFRLPKGAKVYNYCVDLCPTDSYLLTFSDGAFAFDNRELLVRLSPDTRLLEIFSSFLKETEHESE